MSPKQRHILRHSLGLPDGPVLPRTVEDPDWPYHNRYATAPECDGYADVLALVEEGYMRPGRMEHCFHVTEAGIRKAFEWTELA